MIRLALMTREVLRETRYLSPDPAVLEHLRQFHERILSQLPTSLTANLAYERSATPGRRDHSLEDLQLGLARTLGWLEGWWQAARAFHRAPSAAATLASAGSRTPKVS